MSDISEVDVLVIGAGPSGAIASAILHNYGHKVMVMEKMEFPRFSIGESLLPHCMQYIEKAGMLDAVNAHGFQFKNGAAFRRSDKYTDFSFEEKFSEGPGTTFQVERATFDKLLADEAERMGVDIRYKHEITDVTFDETGADIAYTSKESANGKVRAKFVLDASGFGRVLPRLLDLEYPSTFPVRKAIFTHIDDHISDSHYDREKILVTVHPEEKDIWYWLIPFSDGRCSLGIVAKEEQIDSRKKESITEHIQQFVSEAPELNKLLEKAEYNYPAREITGYSANVSTLSDKHFALLGNAGEFLDPVFSSGVTIAMRSAGMASDLLHKQFNGEKVDWQEDYAKPLVKGVNTFRAFVQAWYDGRFQDIIFYENQNPDIRAMISAILAGYAWDETNPYVAEHERRLKTLWGICQNAM